MVAAQSQSHYFSPDSNVSLELGNFGVRPCPPSSSRSAHTHARTHAPTGSQMQLFHHFFLPLSLSLPAAPIDLDRAQTKGGNADSYSQRLIQGTRKASPTGLPPPHHPPSAQGCFLEEKFNLFQPGRGKAARLQSAQLARGCLPFMQKVQ